MKPTALALMEAVSFCAGVRHKRYSVQQETASEKTTIVDLIASLKATNGLQI